VQPMRLTRKSLRTSKNEGGGSKPRLPASSVASAFINNEGRKPSDKSHPRKLLTNRSALLHMRHCTWLLALDSNSLERKTYHMFVELVEESGSCRSRNTRFGNTASTPSRNDISSIHINDNSMERLTDTETLNAKVDKALVYALALRVLSVRNEKAISRDS